MCLILFSYKQHPRYPFILAANRDEFYRRPAQTAAYWEQYPDVLAGRDLEAGGTWLGITRQGRFAALTNYRDPALYKKDALTRGQLVSDYLTGSQPPQLYLAQLQAVRSRYNPFNLLVGDSQQLYYYSPLKNRIEEIEPGLHGLSNAFLDTPWPKVLKGKKLLSDVLDKGDFTYRDLWDILADGEIFEDHRLPQTGVEMAWERLLSSIYIESPDYGTRCSSVLLIDEKKKVTFAERSLPKGNIEPGEVCFNFEIV